jgi:hypothetical protein
MMAKKEVDFYLTPFYNQSRLKACSPVDISLTRAVTKLKTAGLAVFFLFRGILGVLNVPRGNLSVT